jgi:hypothetical protein
MADLRIGQFHTACHGECTGDPVECIEYLGACLLGAFGHRNAQPVDPMADRRRDRFDEALGRGRGARVRALQYIVERYLIVDSTRQRTHLVEASCE